MGRIETTVFVSYRRTNVPWALAISKELTHSGYDVFFDYTGIASGDFERVILENIRARAHFLVLLTPSALERCSEPGDVFRLEIETALRLERNIVPLMLEGFAFNTRGIGDQLTGRLADLKRYNALLVPVDYFDEAMSRLRDRYLNVALDSVLHPLSPALRALSSVHQAAAVNAPAVAKQELAAQQYFERAHDAASPSEEERLLSQAIRLQPDFAEALAARGLIRAQDRRDVAGARQDLDAAVRLKFHSTDKQAVAFFGRARLRDMEGDTIGARADYDAAIRLKPDYAAPFSYRGHLRVQLGESIGAREDYDTAVRLDPQRAETFLLRGYLRQQQGDAVGAQEDYATASRLNPTLGAQLSDARGNPASRERKAREVKAQKKRHAARPRRKR